MTERRHFFRQPLDIYFNKYLDGQPYLCRAVDLSRGGILALTHAEPQTDTEGFSLEIRLPGQSETMWVWGRTAWQSGRKHAIRFVRMDRNDRKRLLRHLSAQCV